MLTRRLVHNKVFELAFRKPALQTSIIRLKSDANDEDRRSHFYPNTSVGIQERTAKSEIQPEPLLTPFPPFPDGKNPKTGEVGGPTGPEPTVFGDWQRKGRVSDF